MRIPTAPPATTTSTTPTASTSGSMSSCTRPITYMTSPSRNGTSPPRQNPSSSIRNTSPASEQTSPATMNHLAPSEDGSSASATPMSTTIVSGFSTYSTGRRSVCTAHQSAAATTKVATSSPAASPFIPLHLPRRGRAPASSEQPAHRTSLERLGQLHARLHHVPWAVHAEHPGAAIAVAEQRDEAALRVGALDELDLVGGGGLPCHLDLAVVLVGPEPPDRGLRILRTRRLTELCHQVAGGVLTHLDCILLLLVAHRDPVAGVGPASDVTRGDD